MAEYAALLFRASPTMRTCGYLIAGSGSYALRLLVLPRFWAAHEKVPARYWFGDDGQTLTVLAYEGQVVSVPIDRSNLPAWEDVLKAAAKLADTVTVEVGDDDELGDNDADAEDGSNEVFVPALAASRSAIGTRRVRMPLCSLWARAPERAAERAEDEEEFSRALAGFGKLLQRAAERMRPTPLGDGDPSPAVTTGGDGANLLRLLLAHRALVSFIKQNVHRIRRGYLEVTETMPVIRGRITQRGVISAVSGSSLAIECTHDEFSELTPLFRLLMTALDRVAQSLPASAEAVLFPQQQAEAAASLRAQLLPIPSMPLQEATSLAPRMQLRGRLRAEWQDALELARIVLAPEQATQFDLSRLRAVGAAVQVVSSTFWEQAVVRGAFEGLADKKGSAGEVWAAANPKQPDCVVRFAVEGPFEKDSVGEKNSDAFKTWIRDFFNTERPDGEATGHDSFKGALQHRVDVPPVRTASGLKLAAVLDAKYTEAEPKHGKGKLSAPASGYQYQMLAYSLLVENCVAAILIHPCAENTPRASSSFRRKVPKDPTTARECHLLVVEHPFPSAENCGANWTEYLRAFRRAVGGSVGEPGGVAEASAVRNLA